MIAMHLSRILRLEHSEVEEINFLFRWHIMHNTRCALRARAFEKSEYALDWWTCKELIIVEFFFIRLPRRVLTQQMLICQRNSSLKNITNAVLDNMQAFHTHMHTILILKPPFFGNVAFNILNHTIGLICYMYELNYFKSQKKKRIEYIFLLFCTLEHKNMQTNLLIGECN